MEYNQKINLNQDWRFLLGDSENGYKHEIDDNDWEQVCIPHCVSLSPMISSGGRNYQGVCWYRKQILLAKENKDKQIILEFSGAMFVLEVWINETKLPTHYCGYTPAVYDITNLIKLGEKNTIAVKLNNSDRSDVPPGKPQADLDFTYEGGLYRNVSLYIKDKLHITNEVLADKIASGGHYITFDNISDNLATVNVQTHIINNRETDEEYILQNRIYDKKGEIIAQSSEERFVKNGTDTIHENMLEVNSPILWSNLNPYLYTVESCILVDDKVIDTKRTTIGIRTFEFTKDRGFILNNKPIKVSGANYHQTYIHVGNAMSDNLLRRDARKLREAGMIHIRAHYPLSDAFMDECDKLGMMVTVSLPGWQYFEDGIFVDRAYKNLRDMVRHLRNHPSVILWEPILNESMMPDYFREATYNIVHEELPNGPCNCGSDNAPADVMYKEFDPGMLGESKSDREKYMKLKVMYDKPKWTREYGDYPDNWTDQGCAWRAARSWGEDAMLKQVDRMIGNKYSWLRNYTSFLNDDSICGFGMWPGIEHNRGYHINPCFGGFLDLCRIPKYSFYFFKSQREPSEKIENIYNGPMVYIANRWSEVSPDDVVVFSNCEKIRIYHNGELIEERKPDTLKVNHPPFTFKNFIKYKQQCRERTEIVVEGLIDDKVVAVDKRVAPGVPNKLYLEPDYMDIPLKADGSDLIFIRCDVHDDLGYIPPHTLDEHDIKFTIEGEGKIIGDYIKRPEVGQTGVLIQSTKNKGKIKIRAELVYPQKYERLAVKPAEIEIESI